MTALDLSRREVARHIAEAEAELAESYLREWMRCVDPARAHWLHEMLTWAQRRVVATKRNAPPPDYSAPV
jgi:hypothetical protein